MKMSTKPEEPSKQPSRAERGAPLTFAAHAVRKDLSVRVLVKQPPTETDELREEGYGHGV